MPVTQLPNFLLRSTTGFEHKLIRYSDYGAIALLDSCDPQCRYVLVTGLHPLPNGRYVWNHINAFSVRSVAVREFSAQCYLFMKEDENEQ